MSRITPAGVAGGLALLSLGALAVACGGEKGDTVWVADIDAVRASSSPPSAGAPSARGRRGRRR